MASSSAPTSFPFPVPKFIEAGCLCGACRFRIDFPKDHDFKTASSSCQCTQCRKQTASLFFFSHGVRPASSSFRWTTSSSADGSSLPAAAKTFDASAVAQRTFCGTCGSLLTWRRHGRDYLCFPVGTVDPLYLFGEGADGKTEVEGQIVPKEGFGLALGYGGGMHEWCGNEIKGVTDQIPILGRLRGRRFDGDEPQ